MKKISKFLQILWKGWCAFWFAEQDLHSVSLFRIVFSLVLFYFYFSRQFDLEIFYTDRGFLPKSFALTADFFSMRPSLFYHIDNLVTIQWLHALLLGGLLCLALGLFTRISAVLVFFLHTSFANRNPAAMYGADMIASFYLFYLIFLQSNAYYSLDKKLFSKYFINSMPQRLSNSVFLRLMQLQLCIIYGYSGLEKLKGTRWWDGSAIWDVFSMGSLQRWDMSFIAHLPVIIAISTYIVLLWEVYFPVLIWNKKLRPYVLLFGISMHIGIGLFLNLPCFAAIMISIYILFLDQTTIVRWMRVFTSANSPVK